MQVPYNEVAEEEVIGCAVATRHGAELAAERLDVDDFYKPAHRRLFASAYELPDGDEEDRLALAAAEAVVDQAEVRQICRARCAMFDTAGTFAQRVSSAADRRRTMKTLAEAFNALGSGAELDEVRPLLTRWAKAVR